MSSKCYTTEQMKAQNKSKNTVLQANANKDSTESTESKATYPSSGAVAQPSAKTRTQSSDTTTASSIMTEGNGLPVPTSARPEDIVCGRGLHIMNRHGNLNLHLLVDKYRQVYLISTRRDKAAIARNIVQEIKSTGARFLRRFDEDKEDDKWVEVDDDTAYKKVSHALRLRKNDHGRKFLKSVEMQQKSNNHMANASRAQASTPVGVTTRPTVHVLPDGIRNSLGVASSVPLDVIGLLRGSRPQSGPQLQPTRMHQKVLYRLLDLTALQQHR